MNNVDDRNPLLEGVLVDLGIGWPFHGYSPGGYSVPCRRCARRTTAARGSFRCLSCALKDAIDTGEGGREAAYTVGFRAGVSASASAVQRLNETDKR